jgi:uncharacterized protein (TIGR02300 family)
MDAARKTKLGHKWACFSCGAKFYDLQKPEPLCPKCGADQRQSPAFEKPKRTRAKKAAPAPKKVVKPPPPVEETEDLDTPIDPEDLEIEDIEIDDPGGSAAAPPAEIEEPEEEPADDDDD